MSDSMEMTILSVLGPALHCYWGVSRYQQAMLSSTFWGSLSDKYGRKPVTNFKTFFINHINNISSLIILPLGSNTLWNFAVSVWSFERGRS
jgi:hypothetical protein